jgi:hypothetical protein
MDSAVNVALIARVKFHYIQPRAQLTQNKAKRDGAH